MSNGKIKVKLIDLAEYINGYAFNEGHWGNTGLPIVRIAQLTGTQPITDFYSGQIDSNHLIQHDEIIFCWSGTLLVTKWKGQGAWLNQHLFKVIPKRNIDRDFFYHLLKYSVAEIEKSAHGSAMVHITRAELAKFEVFFPEDVETQRQIAKKLDIFDSTLSCSRLLINKLQMKKQGLLNDLLSRGVDSQGKLRPSYEDAPDLYQETELGFIPKEWEIIKLDEISEKVTDGTHQAVTTIPLNHEGVPFLFVSCVKEGKILWNKAGKISRRDYQELSKGREPKKGMIIYTVVGSYGDAAALADDREVAFQRNTACIYPNTKLISSDFLVSYLNSESVRKHADRVALGNAQKLITLGELKKYLVALPPLQEQKLIEEKLKVVTDNISFEKENLDKLMLIKTGLLKDLLQN